MSKTLNELSDALYRATMPVEIERGEAVAGGQRKIRGYANTFGVMRSRRIIHPSAIEEWLRANPQAPIKFLAQHGGVGNFATIGKIDKLRVERNRGLYFEATVAEGTELAEEAWTLIRQGLLGSISLGWIGHQARWVRVDDKDLDPWLARKMKDAGTSEAYAFFAVDVVEISLVDVGDDPGALLAAKAGPQGAAFTAALEPLQSEIASLREEVRQLAASGGGPQVAAFTESIRQQTEEGVRQFVDSVIEALTSDDTLRDVARGFHDELADLGSVGDGAAHEHGDDPDLGRLMARVSRGAGL